MLYEGNTYRLSFCGRNRSSATKDLRMVGVRAIHYICFFKKLKKYIFGFFIEILNRSTGVWFCFVSLVMSFLFSKGQKVIFPHHTKIIDIFSLFLNIMIL